MSSDSGKRRPGLLVRLFAVVIDFATLLPLLLAGLIVAFAWLLLRSSAGRYDAETGDTLIAVSLIGATVPAWTAWQAVRLYRLGATFGQARLGLTEIPSVEMRGGDLVVAIGSNDRGKVGGSGFRDRRAGGYVVERIGA